MAKLSRDYRLHKEAFRTGKANPPEPPSQEDYDIQLVLYATHTSFTREEITAVLKRHKGDLVNAIMELGPSPEYK